MRKDERDLTRVARQLINSTGVTSLAVRNVYGIRFTDPMPRSREIWKPSLGLILEGAKQIQLEDTIRVLEKGFFVITPFALPITSRIMKENKNSSYLSILLNLEFKDFSDVDQMLGPMTSDDDSSVSLAIATGRTTHDLSAAAFRLLSICQCEADARALGPSIKREMIYYALGTPAGKSVRNFIFSGQKISNVITRISSDLSEEFDANSAAKKIGVSRAVFYRQFKRVTGMSPIQYQKRLRLLEARRLMLTLDETVERSSQEVGFNSVSQFSREFSRLFGRPPKEEIKAAKKNPFLNE